MKVKLNKYFKNFHFLFYSGIITDFYAKLAALDFLVKNFMKIWTIIIILML